MRITQDVREYAATHGLESTEAIERGMEETAAESRGKGGEIYLDREASTQNSGN